LSVEINTNFLAPYLAAASAATRVPNTLFFTASRGFISIIGVRDFRRARIGLDLIPFK
jgi:hypothetical protein